VGGFDGFRGEIVGDGELFVVEASGVPRLPLDDETAVYAVVAPFVTSVERELTSPSDCAALISTVLPALLPDPAGIYALRISGRFPRALARSFVGFSPPYPSATVLAGDGQVLFELADVEGSIVAMYLPAAADTFCSLGSGCAQAGFHLHFLTTDRSAGGHLLECSLTRATVEIAALRELRLHLGDAVETLRAP
jgi:acetolactate decarboxylase